ncbi:YaiI/YqxD family protein [Clostridium psychrophilum]|uniref:YaiI/YqxD family protein n=1 Tax=Clostridium psychrophilum TaxID=132926 RepID=UPI001C0BCE05|nr:YaiI/YqxD family protein [Clostridium psychrophilum]MBU3181549.1 YaiI/YqxD family protein [Clostridium psychrophilum]
MRIIVDADGCPGKHLIEKAAKENSIELIMYCDINHVLNSDYAQIRYVDSGFQTVDMKVANEAKTKDIVITQDFGVAAMVLAKGAYAMGPKGYIYDDSNIDKLLFERHLSSKLRRSGGKTSGPKKRTNEDDNKLYNSLIKLILKAKTITST